MCAFERAIDVDNNAGSDRLLLAAVEWNQMGENELRKRRMSTSAIHFAIKSALVAAALCTVRACTLALAVHEMVCFTSPVP
jgi:hypothetical protein